MSVEKNLLKELMQSVGTSSHNNNSPTHSSYRSSQSERIPINSPMPPHSPVTSTFVNTENQSFLHNISSSPTYRRRKNGKTPKVTFQMTVTKKQFFIFGIIILVGLLLVMFLLPSRHSSDMSTDYTGSEGKEVLVHLHGSTVSEFADILEKNGVVSHAQLFIDAINDRPVSEGFYIFPQHISAKRAAEMLLSKHNQTGQIMIPPGATLLNHRDNRGKVIPGIFSRIAQASCVRLNNTTHCYTHAKDLMKAARKTSAQKLGIASWELASYKVLHHDVRYLEGLIIAGTWDTIDPRESADKKLRDLIVASKNIFHARGLNSSSTYHAMSPYDILIIASIVEKESSTTSDYGKIARVIFNRLHNRPPMRLDMDSTVNYYFGRSDFDFSPQLLNDPNPWNTRVHHGLPLTPIGTVSQLALEKTLHPPAGKWKYFVTVDDKGTTLFANTYEQHQKNETIACNNHFLVTQC